jgi:hypothetical protein
VPLPLTGAVPIVVPPLVQVVGGLAWGPNTVKVTVPPAVLVAPETVDPIPLGGMAVPAVPVAGAAALVVVLACPTTVDVMPAPQPLVDGLLLASPL